MTQWNVAPNKHVIGLRYEALPMAMRMVGVPRQDWADVFQAVRKIEREALAIFNKANG